MWKSWEYFSDSLIFNSTSNNHIQAPHLFLFLINKDQHDVWWQGGSCRVSALSYYKRHLRLFESMLIASDWRFVQPAGDLRMDRELSGEIIYHRNSWGETGNTLDGWFVYLNVDLYIKYLFLVSPTQVSFTHDPPARHSWCPEGMSPIYHCFRWRFPFITCRRFISREQAMRVIKFKHSYVTWTHMMKCSVCLRSIPTC